MCSRARIPAAGTRPLLLSLLFLLSFAATPVRRADGSAIITIVNKDAPGVGFNDPTPVSPVGGNPGTTLGAQRLYAFQHAADLWGARISSSVPIVVEATFAPINDCQELGAANATTFLATSVSSGGVPANTIVTIALWEKLQGVCRTPCNTAEIHAEFNGAIGTTCPGGWYYGLDSDTWDHDAFAYDLVSVVMHEFAHGLGFSTSIDVANGIKFNGLDDMFINNLKDDSTGKLWRDMTNTERKASLVNTNEVVWVGSNTTAGTALLTQGKDSGGHAELYAPPQFWKGSSLTHWNQPFNCAACDDLQPKDLMAPSYSGPTQYTVLTHLALQDIGWGAVGSGAVDLFVNLAGGDGTVSSVPAGIQYPGTSTAKFPVATTVTLTATPRPGYEFVEFLGLSGFGNNLILQLSNPWTLTMDQPRLVRAKFIAMDPQTLTVVKTGSGLGSVSSSPVGISSCTTTCSAAFAYNTPVILTASPLSGSTFGGWSGEGCSGTGTCIVAMTQGRGVTATFIGPGGIVVGASPNPIPVNQGATITATVTNGSGAPAAYVVVTFATTFPGFFSQGGVYYGSATSTTNASGVATQRFTGSAGGTANITVSAPNATAAIYSLTVQPQGPIVVTLAAAWDSSTLTSTTYRLDALVANVSGTPQSGQRVDFSSPPYSPTPAYGFTGPTGQVSSRVTATSSGLLTATATSSGAQGAVTINAQVGTSGSSPMAPTHTLAVPNSGGAGIYGVAFSPDGTVLAAASNYMNTVTAWNVPSWSQKWSRNTLTTAGRLFGLRISPNSAQVAVASYKGVDVLNVSDGSPVCATSPQISDSSGGSLVAWTSNSSLIGSSISHLFTYPSTCGGGSAGTALSFKDESHMAYTATRGYAAAGTASQSGVPGVPGELYVWNASGSVVTHQSFGQGNNVYDTSFSSDGSNLAVVADGGVVRVFSTTSAWPSVQYSAASVQGNTIYAVTFIDNDTKLAVGGANGKVEILDLLSGGASLRVGTVSGSVYELAWNQVTSDLAAGTSSGNVYVFRPLDPPDVSGPVISITSPADLTVTTATAIATTGEVTDQSGVATFTINAASQALGVGGSFSGSVSGLTEGSNPITYHAVDTLGNASDTVIHVTRVVDRTPPVISNAAVLPLAGVVGAVFGISCTAVDGDTGVASVTATIRNSGGTTVGTLPMSAGASSSYTASFNSAGQLAGAYSVDLTAVDSSPQANVRTVVGAAAFVIRLPAPAVTSVTPTSGTTAGGTTITIAGAGFQPGATVTFGGLPASGVSVSSPIVLSATTPAHASGAVSVAVTNPDGQTATLTPGFRYVAPASAMSLFVLTPCRIFDTRNAGDSPGLMANATRIFDVAGRCGVPSTARAISANVTVTGSTAAGNLTIYPADVSIPTANTISFKAGQTRANNTMLRFAGDGTSRFGVMNWGTSTVHFILDVNGYFQ